MFPSCANHGPSRRHWGKKKWQVREKIFEKGNTRREKKTSFSRKEGISRTSPSGKGERLPEGPRGALPILPKEGKNRRRRRLTIQGFEKEAAPEPVIKETALEKERRSKKKRNIPQT